MVTKEKVGLDSDVTMQPATQNVPQGSSVANMEGTTEGANALPVETQGRCPTAKPSTSAWSCVGGICCRNIMEFNGVMFLTQ